MEVYKPSKGIQFIYILMILVFGNVCSILLSLIVDSYLIVNLIKAFMIVFTLYCLYYLSITMSLKYILKDMQLIISTLWGIKKVIINLKDIECYSVQSGLIKGVKLSGLGNNRFDFGKSVVDKIGIVKMYITCNKKAIYLKTLDMAYGISPELFDEFEQEITKQGIIKKDFEIKKRENVDLYKEKKFFIPFLIVSCLILFMTLNPFILYLNHKLPIKMPLNFNAMFEPITYGTGKQFAFRQMTYGVLNMMILFCMYYASRFYGKYDKKIAYKYIYIPLIITLVFLIIQCKIIFAYM